MAGGADLLDFDEEGVLVAVDTYVFHVLNVPTRFALHPKTLP